MTKRTNRTNLFSRYNRVVVCRSCGNRTTTNTGSGTDLCGPCYEAAGIENEHSDGYHKDEPHPDCPACTGVVTS